MGRSTAYWFVAKLERESLRRRHSELIQGGFRFIFATTQSLHKKKFGDSMPRSVTLLLCMERVKGGFLGKNATEKHEEIYNYLVEGICWPNWIRKRKIRFETINSLYQKVRRNLVQIELDDYVRKSGQKCAMRIMKNQ